MPNHTPPKRPALKWAAEIFSSAPLAGGGPFERLKTKAFEQALAHVRRNRSRRGKQTAKGDRLRAKIERAVCDYWKNHPNSKRRMTINRMVVELLLDWDPKTEPRRRPGRSTLYTHLKALIEK